MENQNLDLKKVEKIISQHAKGFEYEIFFLRRKTLKISSENAQFEKISQAEDFGLGIRLLKDKRVGFSYTSVLEENHLKKLVEDLKEITLLLPPDEANGFQTQQKESKVPSYFDREGLSLPLEEKINLPINFEREIISSHPYIKGTRETRFSETVYEVVLKNSFGVEISYNGTAYSIVTSVLAQSPKGDTNITWGWKGSRFLKDLPLEELKEELTYKLVNTLDPQPFQTKSLKVIFYREAFASLLEVFSEIFLGDNAVKGKTLLLGKEGTTIATPDFNLIDDGTLEKGFSTHPYDDEGTPQQRTVLIEKGTFKGFLHSLYTARKLGKEPTGNGFRNSFTTTPTTGISNLYLQPVKGTLEDLINRAGEVLVVVDLMGLHTVDPISGDFSLGANGILYRDGKKVAAVRGVTVAGNFVELLKKIEAIGEDLAFYANIGSPSVLIKDITVGGV